MKHVLVVDDDEAAADGLRKLLISDGYQATAAVRPADALAALAGGRFDAVVTDLEMPGVHGVEIVRAALVGRPAMVVLVVTAYGESPASEAARRAGATRVFAKPLDYDALAEELAARLT